MQQVSQLPPQGAMQTSGPLFMAGEISPGDASAVVVGVVGRRPGKRSFPLCLFLPLPFTLTLTHHPRLFLEKVGSTPRRRG